MVSNREEIYKVLKSTGLKGTYMCWQEGQAPQLPWFTYRLSNPTSVNADNIVWTDIEQFRAEFYMKVIDLKLISKIKDIITDNFGTYSYDEAYLPQEKCFVVSFTFTPNFRKETNNG